MFYSEVLRELNRAKIKYVVAGGPPLAVYNPIFHGYLELIVPYEERGLKQIRVVLDRLNYGFKGSLKKFGFFYHKKDALRSVTIFPKEIGRFSKFYQMASSVRLNGIRIPLISTRYLKFWQKINKVALTEQLRHGLKSTATQRMCWLQQAYEFVCSLKKVRVVKR